MWQRRRHSPRSRHENGLARRVHPSSYSWSGSKARSHHCCPSTASSSCGDVVVQGRRAAPTSIGLSRDAGLTVPSSSPSALKHSILHKSGSTPSSPFTPQTPRPPSSRNLQCTLLDYRTQLKGFYQDCRLSNCRLYSWGRRPSPRNFSKSSVAPRILIPRILLCNLYTYRIGFSSGGRGGTVLKIDLASFNLEGTRLYMEPELFVTLDVEDADLLGARRRVHGGNVTEIPRINWPLGENNCARNNEPEEYGSVSEVRIRSTTGQRNLSDGLERRQFQDQLTPRAKFKGIVRRPEFEGTSAYLIGVQISSPGFYTRRSWLMSDIGTTPRRRFRHRFEQLAEIERRPIFALMEENWLFRQNCDQTGCFDRTATKLCVGDASNGNTSTCYSQPLNFSNVSTEQLRNARAGKREIAEKTRRPAASSGAIPICENPRATPPGIEPGSPMRETNSSTLHAAFADIFSVLLAGGLLTLRTHGIDFLGLQSAGQLASRLLSQLRWSFSCDVLSSNPENEHYGCPEFIREVLVETVLHRQLISTKLFTQVATVCHCYGRGARSRTSLTERCPGAHGVRGAREPRGWQKTFLYVGQPYSIYGRWCMAIRPHSLTHSVGTASRAIDLGLQREQLEGNPAGRSEILERCDVLERHQSPRLHDITRRRSSSPVSSRISGKEIFGSGCRLDPETNLCAANPRHSYSALASFSSVMGISVHCSSLELTLYIGTESAVSASLFLTDIHSHDNTRFTVGRRVTPGSRMIPTTTLAS
ncbi:hypothetical protein PR048_017723 [Dryococelus australis]|uniref:Uncharacterized protein n=1 Tax=Dryococelus australis TaxID=614101 RepID=A0ABQ9HAA1_9NEOP|nr:hypothetical protein PR048_017723 [Dryococelus australis]